MLVINQSLFVSGITELACLAHLRRRFFEIHAANGSPIAAEALRRIALLYAIERQAKDFAPLARLQLRQAQAKPHPVEFHAWLINTRKAAAHGSGTAKALDHMSNAGRSWRHALLRRSQRHRLPWTRFTRLVRKYLPPCRLVHPFPSERFYVKTFGRSRMQ